MMPMTKSELAEYVKTVQHALPRRDETIARPILIAITGLPGTGKSYLARQITLRMPAIIIESDFVRKTLIPQPNYTGAESALIHQVAFALIERLLTSNCRVISDATNLLEKHRERLRQLAKKTRSQFILIHTTAPDEIVRERLRQRFVARDPLDRSDANYAVHLMLKREMEPIRAPHLIVDTSANLDAAVAKILRMIAS